MLLSHHSVNVTNSQEQFVLYSVAYVFVEIKF